MIERSKIHIGCNIFLEYELFISGSTDRVVIISNGYNVTLFDEPLTMDLKKNLRKHNLSYIHYQYPEQNKKLNLDNLLISSGVNYLQEVYEWLAHKKQFKNFILFGSSFGANISIEIALKKTADLLIIINPVIDYTEYRKKQIGKKKYLEWKKKDTISILYDNEILNLTYRFIQESKIQKLSKRIKELNCSVVAFQSKNDLILNITELRATLSVVEKSCQIYEVDSGHQIVDQASVHYICQKIIEKIQEL